MRSFWATHATPSYPTYPSRIHPALTSLADECAGMLAHLVAYVGALALLAIAGVHLWDQLPNDMTVEPAASAGWSPATRAQPAFAVSQFDISGKTVAYEIFRHPSGGRRDVIRWAAAGEKPVAGIEIYRPGNESSQAEPAFAEIPGGAHALEAAGVVDSKFGAVPVLRLVGQPGGALPCLGFIKRFDPPKLLISGWSCQGDTLPARRAAIGCILNGLTLLTAGNAPKLTQLFARAELRRGTCAVPSATAVDWVTTAENPRLRGAL